MDLSQWTLEEERGNSTTFDMVSTSNATPGELTTSQTELLNTPVDPVDSVDPIDPTLEAYYTSAAGLTGNILKIELNSIIKGHTTFSYSDAWTALVDTDEDPNNSDNFILLYTGRSIPKTEAYPSWNREHVWGKSHGDRSNKDFDIGGTEHSEATGNYTDSDSWEPRDEVKGDVTRMIFYMAVRYKGGDGYVDLEIAEGVNTGLNKEPLHGNLSVLKEWHTSDPVSDFEISRNNII